jgi:hypothetical protein
LHPNCLREKPRCLLLESLKHLSLLKLLRLTGPVMLPELKQMPWSPIPLQDLPKNRENKISSDCWI